ncbi:MAG: hypothetical protein P0Y66_21215 [Candidatus Kaistia colombiensis]|nr:MAG: hypothetical protein P0Y66_21215 [Kaistia sp.]
MISGRGTTFTTIRMPSARSGTSARSRKRCRRPELLLKLLFTSQPLSIQVHPDDAYARSMGQPHGKTEAWYILAAEPDAAVAVGLKREMGPEELRAAIEDGSIADLVQWHPVRVGEVVSHSGRHHPRRGRRPGAGRDPAAQRHDVPAVRLWPQARAACRGGRRGGACRAAGAAADAAPARACSAPS